MASPSPTSTASATGHTVLAIPGLGGVRHEDAYQVTPTGGRLLAPYPVKPVIEA